MSDEKDGAMSPAEKDAGQTAARLEQDGSEPAATSAGSQEPAEEAAVTRKAPRRRLTKNRKATIAVVAAAVVVVLGAGFWTWHMQPGFCNFMCHSPQDNYVASYYAQAAGTNITPHAKAGMNCLSCHEATPITQMKEVSEWLGDTYQMTDDGFLVQDDVAASKEFCLRDGCHTWDSVVKSTANYEGNEGFNPHASHQDGSITCNDCHKVHQTSQFYCAKCHDVKVPEGWEATNE